MPHRPLRVIASSAYRSTQASSTQAKVERASGVVGDTLRACAKGRKDDWDRRLPLAVT